MTIDIEKVQAALHVAVGSSRKPSKAQILEISGMTYIEDACNEINGMIGKRLKHTDTYGPPEIYYTLVLMLQCLPIASKKFVDFCIDELQHLVSLTKYERSTDREMSVRICDKALSLSRLLLDPPRLAEKRMSTLTETGSVAAPPPTRSTTIPLPTLPTSPVKPKKSPPAIYRPMGSLPLTPDTTPPDRFLKLGTSDGSKGRAQANSPRGDDTAEASQCAPFYFLEKEVVAAMTFKSDDLDLILRILGDRFKPGPPLRRNPNELVKALTLVHHCLYWGSDPFLEYCLGIKSRFEALREHSVPQVRGHARAVVDLLDDSPRLHRERQHRAALEPRRTISAKTPETSTRKPVVEAPLSSPDKSHTRRIPILEPVLDLSRHVTKIGSCAVTGGGYADIWKGEYRTGSSTVTVAIKILRRFGKVDPKRREQRLNRELRAWHGLVHGRISPFYGITLDAHGDVGMVSPFYFQGNATDYVKNNQEVDPLKIGIAEGVEYLHAHNLVHGDIKGANVMISDEGTPKLIDFGLAQVIDDFAEATGYTTSSFATSLRWSAPELLIGVSSLPPKTKKSDVYAAASTCIEIMTLGPPYRGLMDSQVLLRVTNGGIPDRPSIEDRWSPCDELWDFLKTCWRNYPRERPTITAVKLKLGEFYNGVIKRSRPPRRVRFDEGH